MGKVPTLYRHGIFSLVGRGRGDVDERQEIEGEEKSREKQRWNVGGELDRKRMHLCLYKCFTVYKMLLKI